MIQLDRPSAPECLNTANRGELPGGLRSNQFAFCGKCGPIGIDRFQVTDQPVLVSGPGQSGSLGSGGGGSLEGKDLAIQPNGIGNGGLGITHGVEHRFPIERERFLGGGLGTGDI